MFDTLLYTKKLEAAGMTRDQAEAQVNVIAEMVVDGVATKQDIGLLKAETQKEFAELRLEIAAFEAKLLGLEHRLTLRMGAMFAASTSITIAVLAWIK